MPRPDVIVVGASAGGVEALSRLVRGLPRGLPAAIAVVLHTSPTGPSLLPNILSRAGSLPASAAKDGEELLSGHVYVSSPDHHLVLKPNRTLRVVRGPQENRHRPAIDPLFRSAAQSFESRVIGVLLSGTLDDGTAGLYAIKESGGVTIVQDPAEAIAPGMPRNALKHVQIDYCLPTQEIASLLVQLTSTSLALEQSIPRSNPATAKEVKIAEFDMAEISSEDKPGGPSVFTCPDCSGTLFEISDKEVSRYRCRVGHAYSPENVLKAQGAAFDRAVWTALRMLEERIAFLRLMASKAESSQNQPVARDYEARWKELEEQAGAIRTILMKADYQV
jgi:two-component system, chemotaxis family, protein-glutamate methylesterase/glutaminase